jgi:uncharacterized membrane protein YphA (DoxX/SURF4 family)
MKRNIAATLNAEINSTFYSNFKRRFIKYTPVISSFLLAALFLYAAYNKLAIYKTFVSQLKNSPIFGGYENIFSWIVPGTEIIIAVLLLIKRTRLLGLWSSFFLMLLFTVYVFILPHFFSNPGCSCGGIISRLSWEEHFYFNLGFTLLAGLGVSLYSSKKK